MTKRAQNIKIMNRKIENKTVGYQTEDGGGVKLVRVLSTRTIRTYDPILMLDSFDSLNPADYTKGFPLHPHRGIETVSYLAYGRMMHRDSAGHTDTIGDGEVQWMTAGSGIMHEEKIPPAERMLGVQLWLNLPRKDKMAKPEYFAVKADTIQKIELEGGGVLNLLTGSYKEHKGHKGKYLPLDYYDIQLRPGASFEIDTDENKSIALFTLEGGVEVEGEKVEEKTAVHLTQGDKLIVKALDKPTHLLYISSDPLREPVAWGGPIVMNTEEELDEAFSELQSGTFIKEEIKY